MPLDPQARAMLDAMAAMPSPDFSTLRAADYRAALAAMPGFAPGDSIAAQQDLTIEGAAGPLPARLYRPDNSAGLPLIVYFHGGGFVLCGLDSHDNICRSLARRSGALVLSVDYRLAPEARLPGRRRWIAWAGQRAHQQRVAVRRRLGDQVRADIASGACAVVDHDLLAERARQALGQRTADDIGGTAGRVRHHEADRLVGIVVGRGQGRGQQKAGASQRRQQQGAARRTNAAAGGNAGHVSLLCRDFVESGERGGSCSTRR